MKFSLRFQEPLSRHLPIRTGGPCDAYVVAHDDEAVVAVLCDCREAGWSVHVLGAGTRTVFKDGGFDGVCLRLGTGFVDIAFPEPTLVTAGAATPVPAVLAAAAREGLAPAAELLVIPGSFGASLVLEDWDLVSASIARPAKRATSQIVEVDEVSSRTKGVVLRGTVRLEAVGVEEAERRFRKALKRAAVPPGSWVRDRRPVRDTLRRASLERVRLRDVAIPEEAPELLINLGSGSARDLHLLHRSSLDRVKRTRGVDLESLVKWVGQS